MITTCSEKTVGEVQTILFTSYFLFLIFNSQFSIVKT